MKIRFNTLPLQIAALAGFSWACTQTPPAEAPKQPSPSDAAASQAAPAPIIIKDVGLQTPESILPDPASDTYLVSNINGGPLDKDDNGFISKLSPDGKVITLKWIDGASPDVELNAPKGLGISGGKLFVADIDTIRTFDAVTGKPLAQIKVEGASFLNDVSVAPDGTVYVSDTGLRAGKDGLEADKKDAIYKVDPAGHLSTLIKGEELGQPNGVFADANGVSVCTWTGTLYHVSLDGKQEAVTHAPGAQLDGLVRTADGQTIVSSWEKSMVYLGNADGQFSPLVSDLKAPADLSYDVQRNQILVPLFMDNAIEIQKLPQLTATAKATNKAPASTTAEAK
jgi:sugar lactone lactonase YvrE